MPGQLAQDIVGSHRDLSDVVTVVDARNTPLISMLPKEGQVHDSLLLEWPVDVEEEPGENAVVEAKDVTEFDNALDGYAILQNRMQWFRRQAMVGKLAQNAQNQAGIKDKKNKAIAKKILQLKRDMEVRFCGDGGAAKGAGTVPNKARALGVFIQSGAQTDGVDAVPENYRPPAASIYSDTLANLDEDGVQAAMESQFQVCGAKKTYTCLCGTKFKKKFRQFTQTQFGTTNVASSVRFYSQDIREKKLVNTIDLYEGDFGTLELVTSLWLAYLTAAGAKQPTVSNARAYVLDMEMLALVNKQRPQVMPLPDQGGGPRFLVDAIASLKVLNPKGLAKFASAS